MSGSWSGKRDLNPRLRPWQGRTLPLSYSRKRVLGGPTARGGSVARARTSTFGVRACQGHGRVICAESKEPSGGALADGRRAFWLSAAGPCPAGRLHQAPWRPGRGRLDGPSSGGAGGGGTPGCPGREGPRPRAGRRLPVAASREPAEAFPFGCGGSALAGQCCIRVSNALRLGECGRCVENRSARFFRLGGFAIEGPISGERMRGAKIVCTMGPSTLADGVIERLVEEGMDCARLNFSHGEQAGYLATVQRIRAAAAKSGHQVSILADLRGPKIRVGKFPGGPVDLVVGQEFTLCGDESPCNAERAWVSYELLAQDAKPGDLILLDDGLLAMRVKEVRGADVVCIVETGGKLSDRKGVNLPGVKTTLPALTPKDISDLKFAVEVV